MQPPQFNLSAEDALDVLEAQADKNEKQTAEGAENEFLKDIKPETAYDLGYRTAIQDFASVTGDDPREVLIVEVPIPKEAPDGSIPR
jgi:hypothetical protein